MRRPLHCLFLTLCVATILLSSASLALTFSWGFISEGSETWRTVALVLYGVLCLLSIGISALGLLAALPSQNGGKGKDFEVASYCVGVGLVLILIVHILTAHTYFLPEALELEQLEGRSETVETMPGAEVGTLRTFKPYGAWTDVPL
ncbi:hypothetical protein C8R46DRAFT_1027661 [Mycena filopes]|nr:hypothetical protein C8R46DRAFT_1027661 [Mycena filopes]